MNPAGSPARADGGGHRADIDGLRAIAVALVVLYHAFPQAGGGGFIGVDVFFVLSGYLITGIVARDVRAGQFRLADFYARRIRRIYPALCVVLLASLVAGWWLLLPNELANLGRHVAGGSGFVANFLYWSESGYFDVQTELKPLLHLWSLGVEEQFYIVWPLLLPWWLHLPPARARQALGALLLLSLLACVVTTRLDPEQAFFFPHTRFWELGAGGWLALREAAGGTAYGRRDAVSLLGLCAIAAGVWLIDVHSAFPGAWALLPVGGALALIHAGPEAVVNRRLLARAPMVRLGLISYSLYLWHWPLLSFSRIRQVGEPGAGQRLAIVGLSLLLAWLTWRYVETPWRRRPVVAGRIAPVPALVATMAVAGAAGLLLWQARGYPDRFPEQRDYLAFFDDYHYSRTHDLLRYDRHDCNYYDIEHGTAKAAIADACLQPAPGRRRTVLLWGDSHAQHLSFGLAQVLPAEVALLHIGASGCPPGIDDLHPDPLNACNRANHRALGAVDALRPDIVLLAQQHGHSPERIDALIARLHGSGVREVVLVGPVPQWDPFLYQVILKKYWIDTPVRIASNLEADVFATDAQLERHYAGLSGVTYVSLVRALCRDGACLAYLDGDRKEKLITYDYGHFTLPASEFVVRTAVYPALRHLLD